MSDRIEVWKDGGPYEPGAVKPIDDGEGRERPENRMLFDDDPR